LKRFPYVVYYRVEAERLVILAVQHGRRDEARWHSRV
jgi:plasmid stabilization system protein ParE